MKPNIAFIGLGIMGHRMLANMTAHGGFTLLGGWDPSAEAQARTRTPDIPTSPNSSRMRLEFTSRSPIVTSGMMVTAKPRWGPSSVSVRIDPSRSRPKWKS